VAQRIDLRSCADAVPTAMTANTAVRAATDTGKLQFTLLLNIDFSFEYMGSGDTDPFLFSRGDPEETCGVRHVSRSRVPAI
jgi:hypothetical protein